MLVPTSVTPTGIVVTIPGILLVEQGAYVVTVVNPGPGGGFSNGVNLNVKLGTIVIPSLSAR